jgi:hypothetical protein
MIRFEFEFAKANSNFYVEIRIRIRRIFPSFSKFEFANIREFEYEFELGEFFPTPD